MDENTHRVERIKTALGCNKDAELAKHIKSHPPNITRWKKRGFYPSTANLIDALLDVVEKLSRKRKN